MKTILVPTDFNEHSVHLTQDVLGNFENETVKIIFFHAFRLTDSISDLLMLSRRTAEYSQVTETFHKACFKFREENTAKISAIAIECFYGSTMASFRNFLAAHEVDTIFYPPHYNFNKISKYSIDPGVLLRKSGIPVIVPAEQPPVMEAVLIQEILNPVSETA